jgi:hypothetical protein
LKIVSCSQDKKCAYSSKEITKENFYIEKNSAETNAILLQTMIHLDRCVKYIWKSKNWTSMIYDPLEEIRKQLANFTKEIIGKEIT